MSRTEPVADQSMEEILASIRRIISEDPGEERNRPQPSREWTKGGKPRLGSDGSFADSIARALAPPEQDFAFANPAPGRDIPTMLSLDGELATDDLLEDSARDDGDIFELSPSAAASANADHAAEQDDTEPLDLSIEAVGSTAAFDAGVARELVIPSLDHGRGADHEDDLLVTEPDVPGLPSSQLPLNPLQNDPLPVQPLSEITLAPLTIDPALAEPELPPPTYPRLHAVPRRPDPRPSAPAQVAPDQPALGTIDLAGAADFEIPSLPLLPPLQGSIKPGSVELPPLAHDAPASLEVPSLAASVDAQVMALAEVLAQDPVPVGPVEVAGTADEPARSQPAQPPSLPQSLPVADLDDKITELLKPMLQDWINTNMPKLIEKALKQG